MAFKKCSPFNSHLCSVHPPVRGVNKWTLKLWFLSLWFNEDRPLCSYLFTTKRFPKTWPKARGPRGPNHDLLSECEQTRWVASRGVTGPWDFFGFKFTTRIRPKRILSSPDLYESTEAEAADLITATSLNKMLALARLSASNRAWFIVKL